jgi:hypothetical protein
MLSQNNKPTERYERNTKKKRSNQTIPICLLYDAIPTQESPENNLDLINTFIKTGGLVPVRERSMWGNFEVV